MLTKMVSWALKASSVGSENGQLTKHLDAVRQHKKIYGGEDDGNQADDRSMGSAAAMQALKMFSGGGSGSSQVGHLCSLHFSSSSVGSMLTHTRSKVTARVPSLVRPWLRQARLVDGKRT